MGKSAGCVVGVRHNFTIAMADTSEGAKSADWTDEHWGAGDPGVGMEGAHMTVLGG